MFLRERDGKLARARNEMNCNNNVGNGAVVFAVGGLECRMREI